MDVTAGPRNFDVLPVFVPIHHPTYSNFIKKLKTKTKNKTKQNKNKQTKNKQTKNKNKNKNKTKANPQKTKTNKTKNKTRQNKTKQKQKQTNKTKQRQTNKQKTKANKTKHLLWTELCAFYDNLLKIHPIYVNLAPVSDENSPIAIPKFAEKTNKQTKQNNNNNNNNNNNKERKKKKKNRTRQAHIRRPTSCQCFYLHHVNVFILPLNLFACRSIDYDFDHDI